MATKKQQRVGSLLKRFQFIDLARAVTTQGTNRRLFLRDYAFGGAPTSSYESFRKCLDGLYGVTRALDLSPRMKPEEALAAVTRTCNGKDEEMNLSAARSLQGLLRVAPFEAFEHHLPQSLSLGPDSKCSFRLAHYLVRNSEAVFQFPYPRRKRPTDHEMLVMLSLINFAFVKGDFEHARVEIADLSCETAYIRDSAGRTPSPRAPRLFQIDAGDLINRDDLQPEIDDVYRVLVALGDEP